MATVRAGSFDVDYWEVGAGSPVVLVHSSASGNRQWRRLADDLKDRHRLIAVNLFGYGATSPWPADRPQALGDQAELVVAAAAIAPAPVALVGHSLGAAVALEAALRLGPRARLVIVFEPILFYLLRQHDPAAIAEIGGISTQFRRLASAGDWPAVGDLFIDYWSGAGTWAAIPQDRRAGMLPLLQPVASEWDAVESGERPLAEWSNIAAPVHVIRAADTRRPTYSLATLLTATCGWPLHEVPAGGHMAPVARPDLVNPLIAKLIAEGLASGPRSE